MGFHGRLLRYSVYCRRVEGGRSVDLPYNLTRPPLVLKTPVSLIVKMFLGRNSKKKSQTLIFAGRGGGGRPQ